MRYLAVLLLLLGIVSCSNNKKVVIKGQLKGCPHEFVYLSEIEVSTIKLIDSTRISHSGEFNFRTKISNPTFYQLHFVDNRTITLLTEPGERITLTATFDSLPEHYEVEGSKGSTDIQKLSFRLQQTNKSLEALKKVYDKAIAEKRPDTSITNIANQFIKIQKVQHDSTVRYLIQNLHSMACVYAIYQKYSDNNYVLRQIHDIQYIKIVSDTLHKYYPQSNHVKALYKERDELITSLKQAELNAMINKKLKEQDDSLKRH